MVLYSDSGMLWILNAKYFFNLFLFAFLPVFLLCCLGQQLLPFNNYCINAFSNEIFSGYFKNKLHFTYIYERVTIPIIPLKSVISFFAS